MAHPTPVVPPSPPPPPTPHGADGTGREPGGDVTAEELSALLAALNALADGDFTTRLTGAYSGMAAELAAAVNRIANGTSHLSGELDRVRREVVRHGRLDERLAASPGRGAWTGDIHAANALLDALTVPMTNATRVLDALSAGDLSQRAPLHDGTRQTRGDLRRLTRAVNHTADALATFSGELTRLAREVGTDGRLGGRARLQGLQGAWRETTESVNLMATRLTTQVRDIAEVTTAVARGDLNRKVTVDAAGELLELKLTVNTMVEQLSAFADEVTRVAREVGTEGRLGGRARVEGVHGTWKQLTAAVNELAANLTTQVRAIAEVASAVAAGDMSREISVEAAGEVAELKKDVNRMVSNLRETTRTKDWLESNLARLATMMRGHRDLVEVADLILRELAPVVGAQFGAFFLVRDPGPAAAGDAQGGGLRCIAGYGTGLADAERQVAGGGLVEQVAQQRERILLTEVPPGYLSIGSGLGAAPPACVVILPVMFEGEVLGVLELASFSVFSDVHLAFFDQFGSTLGTAINTILANSRTESLLSESQRLTRQLRDRSAELQRQQEELRKSNAELELKAAELTAASQYKSEFLANMSHELRTPLNALLILARLLADNAEGNLSEQEVQFAETITRSGTDLLTLINDVLDLSKIEAGRMDVRPGRVPLIKVLNYVHSTFRPQMINRGLAFDVAVGEDVPRVMLTDGRRLQQVLRNLLSNAVKFTPSGRIELRVSVFRQEGTDGDECVDFTVTDTGIGISAERLPMVFEAFQQADGSTGRKYGGTGLGLSISREIAAMLGGRLFAQSTPDHGSTFTLRVPVVCPGAPSPEEPEPAPVLDTAAVGVPDGVPEREPDWPAAAGLERWQTGRPAEVFEGRRVLIADDDVRNAFALTHVLGRVGMSVLYAENGRECIEVLGREKRVDLVLMDIMMPELDGYGTARQIRASPRLAGLPIVALTAKAMPGDREESLASGVSAYVPKPVDIDRLLSVLLSLLEGAADGPAAPTEEPPPGAP